jgi:hypothetical protein
MVTIKIEFDENEILAIVKQEWYSKVRHNVSRQLEAQTALMVENFLRESKPLFKEMLLQALQGVLERYHIRDLKDVERLWFDAGKDDDNVRG